MDARIRQDIHIPAEESFQLLFESNEVEERPVLFHFDQQIDVAVGPVVSAGDRPEYAHVPRAVLCGNPEDLFAVLVNRHGWRSEAL
jgi:hypothetical protein